jgi:carbohydrate kinase (thermoresistant glucokinase family)
METPPVLVICGVSGAGKSTVGRLLAERLGREFHDADDFHPPANVAKMRRGEPLSDVDRGPWLDELRGLIERCAREGRPAVVACSALKAAYRDRLGIDQRRVVSVFLRGARDLIAERLAGRRHDFMPASLLDSQFEALEPPAGGIHVEVDAPPDAIVERIVAALAHR